MLLKTIYFDSKNPNWNDDRELNYMFLCMQERYINDIINVRGYIYLNQIHELLGIKWDTNDENLCIKNNGKIRFRYIDFEIFNEPDNSVTVLIYRHD